MKYYWFRLKNNRNYKIVFILIFIFMNIDLLILNLQMNDYDPNHSTFLAGASFGHYAQMLILWVLPAYILLGASSWYSIDEKTKNSSILITRFGKKKYITKYLLSVFISSFFLIFINLLINYILALFINKGGTISAFAQSWNDYSSIGDLQFQLGNPILTNLIFIITTSFFIATFSVFISCLSFIFTKISYVFLLSFVLWLILITGNHSILLTFQPFTEYSFLHIGKIYISIVIILLIINLILSIYMVKKDDL